MKMMLVLKALRRLDDVSRVNEPRRTACHQTLDQMWDVHSAVGDKLEPITISVPPPQGPQRACLTWELR